MLKDIFIWVIIFIINLCATFYITNYYQIPYNVDLSTHINLINGNYTEKIVYSNTLIHKLIYLVTDGFFPVEAWVIVSAFLITLFIYSLVLLSNKKAIILFFGTSFAWVWILFGAFYPQLLSLIAVMLGAYIILNKSPTKKWLLLLLFFNILSFSHGTAFMLFPIMVFIMAYKSEWHKHIITFLISTFIISLFGLSFVSPTAIYNVIKFEPTNIMDFTIVSHIGSIIILSGLIGRNNNQEKRLIIMGLLMFSLMLNFAVGVRGLINVVAFMLPILARKIDIINKYFRQYIYGFCISFYILSFYIILTLVYWNVTNFKEILIFYNASMFLITLILYYNNIKYNVLEKAIRLTIIIFSYLIQIGIIAMILVLI